MIWPDAVGIRQSTSIGKGTFSWSQGSVWRKWIEVDSGEEETRTGKGEECIGHKYCWNVQESLRLDDQEDNTKCKKEGVTKKSWSGPVSLLYNIGPKGATNKYYKIKYIEAVKTLFRGSLINPTLDDLKELGLGSRRRKIRTTG